MLLAVPKSRKCSNPARKTKPQVCSLPKACFAKDFLHVLPATMLSSARQPLPRCGDSKTMSKKSALVWSAVRFWKIPTTSNQARSEEHTSELQSRPHLVCRLLLEKKKKK